MPRLGYRPELRARGGLVGALLGASLALATVFAGAPAGASNQNVTFTLTPVAFGSVVIGTSTTGQTIVTNTTAQNLYFISANPSNNSTGAEFHASAGSCVGALAPTASCDVAVVFAPNQARLRASTLTVRFGEKNAKGAINAAAAFQTSLLGTGVKPTFVLSGANAGSVTIHHNGTATATVTNNSIIPLSLHGLHLQGVAHNDFSISAVTCPSQLLPGGSCNIVVNFKPYRTGSASVTLTVSMLLHGTKGSLVVEQSTISGNGVLVGGKTAAFSLSPVSFGSVTDGTSATGSSVFTNTSLVNESLLKTWLKSSPPAFSITGNNCPASIAPAASCEIDLAYAPAYPVTQNGTLAAQVSFVNAKHVTVTAGAQTSLTGSGLAPTFSVSTPSFPNTTVGATSDAAVTVTNTSLVPLSYDHAGFQGASGSSWSLQGSTCAGAIAPAGSCTLEIAFSPRGQGVVSETLNVVLDLTVRAHTTSVNAQTILSGQGSLPTFTVGAPTLAATPKGVAVTGLAAVTNTSNVSLSYKGASFSGTNAGDFKVIGSTCTALLAPTSTCDLTVQFEPSASAPGTENATLRVAVDIAGTSPTISTSVSQAVSGTES